MLFVLQVRLMVVTDHTATSCTDHADGFTCCWCYRSSSSCTWSWWRCCWSTCLLLWWATHMNWSPTHRKNGSDRSVPADHHYYHQHCHCFTIITTSAAVIFWFHFIRPPVCLWIMYPHSRAPKKNTSHGNEVLPQDTMHLIQRPCYQWGSLPRSSRQSDHTKTSWPL